MSELNRPVYVLGAGFCLDFRPALTSGQSTPGGFPLARDFLKVAKEQNVYRTEDAHRPLSMFIRKYFGDDPSPDVERVLSFLAADPFDRESAKEENRPFLYDQLVNIITGTLSAASASVAGRYGWAMRRKISRNEFSGDHQWEAYSRFAQELIGRHAIIITFNYDLLIEFLLRSTGSWGMHDGYGIDIPPIDEAMPPQLRRTDSPPPESTTPSSCLLLKLHGSINWGVPIHAKRSVSAERVQRLVLAAPKFYRIPNDGKYGNLNFQTLKHPEIPGAFGFRPVIVPPVLDKSPWLNNINIRSIWNQAAGAVRKSEEITFIGYSLPPTDFLAEFMPREGNGGASTKRITVVSPDAKELVEGRFASVFGTSIEATPERFIKWAEDRYSL
jgi:hypothetical protein